MPRHQPGFFGFIALFLAACTPTAPPTKLGEKTTVVTPPRAAVDPSRPFRSPSLEPPPPRSGAQLPAEELAGLLKVAAEQAASDPDQAIAALRGCANRLPPSYVCEGRLGVLLSARGAYRAEAAFYLTEAATHAAAEPADPSVDAGFYRAVGDALMALSRHEAAVTAFSRLLALDAADAADHERLANALQGLPDRQVEAAAALQQAFERAPTELRFLYDQAVLLSQVDGELPRSIALLRDYLERLGDTDPARAGKVKARIKELEGDLRADPTPLVKRGGG